MSTKEEQHIRGVEDSISPWRCDVSVIDILRGANDPDSSEAAQMARVEATEAADFANDLKGEASNVRIDLRSEAGETMQAYVDRIAAIATLLDAQIRSGADKGDTRELYFELRRIRLDVLELARFGKVDLPPGAAESFEALMNDLGRYYSDDSSTASQAPQPVTD